MKKVFLILCLIIAVSSWSQTRSCTELYDFIIESGYKKSSLPNDLLGPAWQYEVAAYIYDYKTYLVAKVKKDEYDLYPKAYISATILYRIECISKPVDLETRNLVAKGFINILWTTNAIASNKRVQP